MIRKNKPEDRGFIVNSWLRSYNDSNMSGVLPTSLYWQSYEPLVDEILDSPETQVLVFSNPEDIDQIFGYIVYSASQLYYVYVKQSFRNRPTLVSDIALKLLLASNLSMNPLRYVFNTHIFGCFLRKHSIHSLWAPNVLKKSKTLGRLSPPETGALESR